VAVVCALTLSAGPAAAKKDREELEAERDANIAQLKEIAEQSEGVTNELADAYVALHTTELELPVAEQALKEADDAYVTAKRDHEKIAEDLAEAQQLQQDIQAEIVQAENAATEARLGLGEIARVALMREPLAQSDLMLLLGATTLEELDLSYMASDAVTRNRAETLRIAQEDAATNKNREARLQAVAADISRLEAAAHEAMIRAEEAKTAAAEAKQAVEMLMSQQKAQAQALEEELAALKEQEKQIQAIQAGVEADLKALAAAQKAAAPDGGPPLSPGMFGAPLTQLVLTSPFGPRVHPILGTVRVHTGADFSAGCGTSIYAAADGDVISTGNQPAWGNRTEISHGLVGNTSIVSTYNHQMNGGILVSPGDHVTKGQLIGQVGTTGWSTGCHLHFEIYEDGVPVNPVPYLS
jgi:murein DD-endopeptidase MepM/ murein hydrolase activator NlpD